jgi:hypothetical protein
VCEEGRKGEKLNFLNARTPGRKRTFACVSRRALCGRANSTSQSHLSSRVLFRNAKRYRLWSSVLSGGFSCWFSVLSLQFCFVLFCFVLFCFSRFFLSSSRFYVFLQVRDFSTPPLMSEDCFFLNVYVPATVQPDSPPLPVMVWIHGGGFQSGSANTYNGSYLVSGTDPVIFVSLNYRLSTFGFFVWDDPENFNLGIQDQRLALQWVQDNIAFFGGDNKRVTIMGESAGSTSVFYHLVDKKSWNLFHRGIAESAGPAIWPSTNQ